VNQAGAVAYFLVLESQQCRRRGRKASARIYSDIGPDRSLGARTGAGTAPAPDLSHAVTDSSIRQDIHATAKPAPSVYPIERPSDAWPLYEQYPQFVDLT
jgi:hypothetical protein